MPPHPWGDTLGYPSPMGATPEVRLSDGTRLPALGMGTWRMGERPGEAAREARALVEGIDQGLGLIDTAEMYADGRAETVVARAIAGRRDRVFLVSKVLPQNAGRTAAVSACERSLARLGTDHLDLYLLHWRGRVPLAETLEAFERLVQAGKIRRWGVSNFDVEDLDDLAAAGGRPAVNQILYHLAERGPETAVLPRMARDASRVMAYSPLDEGRLVMSAALGAIAREAGTAPATLALAWLLAQPGVITIPKAVRTGHRREVRAAADFVIDRGLRERLEAAFPRPPRRTPLAML